MTDPEIAAMSSVATALDGLDSKARLRILRWAGERYDDETANNHQESSNIAQSSKGDQTVSEKPDDPAFELFAELFSAADPRSNEDKALVAAYWTQVIGGKDQWQSRVVNQSLKDLGHGLVNVTDALTNGIRRKPQRVLQVKKSGSSKQAIKTYRMTREGIDHVEDLIAKGRR